MSKRTRQYLGIICAIVLYYLIHEGAHLVTAICYGVFKKVNFLGLGVQIDVYNTEMTDVQMGIFCIAGAVATFVCGWLLIALRRNICKNRSKLFRAVMWYTSIIMLFLDPLYLSVLCGFFGGGDMNGISLIVPDIAARIVSGVIFVIHGIIVWRYLLPEYTRSFAEQK